MALPPLPAPPPFAESRTLESLGFHGDSTSCGLVTAPANEIRQDSELPGYHDDRTAPRYDLAADGIDVDVEPEEQEDAPPIFLTYRLRKYSRRHFEFSPIGTETSGLYVVRTQDMTWMSSRKQDVLFGRAPDGTTTTGTCPKEMKQICTARFIRSGGSLPWKPRTKIYCCNDNDSNDSSNENGCNDDHTDSTIELSLEPHLEWTFHLNGKRRYWRRNPHPWRLDLFEDEAPGLVRRKASFVYSASGTRASEGRAVGTLRIFCGRVVLARPLVERMLCSLATVIVYWRDLGKLLVNEGEA